MDKGKRETGNSGFLNLRFFMKPQFTDKHSDFRVVRRFVERAVASGDKDWGRIFTIPTIWTFFVCGLAVVCLFSFKREQVEKRSSIWPTREKALVLTLLDETGLCSQ